MMDWVIQLCVGLPPEIASALLASLPVAELRGALPIALFVFDLSPVTAYVWTVMGNLIPIPVIYLFLPRLMALTLKHTPRINRRFDTFFDRLMKKYGNQYSKWGAFFLFLFVAVPLPGTGAWTGALLAVLFRVQKRYAIPFIALGVAMAGILVLALSLGVFQGMRFL